MTKPDKAQPSVGVERLEQFQGPDLHDLCDATEAAILDGGGFGWLAPPPFEIMESYWKGVLLVPERDLFVARLDGTIAGSVVSWTCFTSRKKRRAPCSGIPTAGACFRT